MCLWRRWSLSLGRPIHNEEKEEEKEEEEERRRRRRRRRKTCNIVGPILAYIVRWYQRSGLIIRLHCPFLHFLSEPISSIALGL